MFKDKYKKDNEFIKPDSKKLNEIEEKIRFSSYEDKKKYFYKKPAFAVFASFLILVLGGFLFKNIYINSEENNPLKSAKVESNVVNKDSYSAIYKKIDKLISKNSNEKYLTNSVDSYSTVKESVESSEDSLNNDYTDTNVQVSGVSEGDIVKTDGNYIYSLSNNNLYISKAENGNINLSSKINLSSDESYNPLEIYVEGNKLVVLYEKYSDNTSSNTSEKAVLDMYYRDANTYINIYDISDKENPKLINSLNQNGSYSSSRMIKNKLYLISNYNLNSNDIEKNKPETFIPTTYNGKETKCIEAKDIYIEQEIDTTNYILATSLDIENPYEFQSEKAVLGASDNIYMSLENLYVTSYGYEEKDGYGYDKTNITKFKLNNGSLEFKASESINGSLLNQFSMDEKDDYLRVATTLNKGKLTTEEEYTSYEYLPTSNNLYILDSDLKAVGAIEDIAENETIYSVRFDGDIGYFVTFKEVDPLFSVDLSNPSNPTILGSLKIPGFSEYMHPFKENLLLGLGKEATENGEKTGLKLSMFDTSDKGNISEINKLVIEDYKYSYSFYNHKSITVDSNKNLISFPAINDYVIFEYSKEKGFTEKGKITFETEDDDNYIYEDNIRGIYINNFLYLCSKSWIKVYSLENFNEVSSCNFN
ncbi:MAG: beta-propeller domain-containing protein [Clostridium sp.]